MHAVIDMLRIYLVTYNVATRPPEQDLNSLFDYPSKYDPNKSLPDFYIVGLQEVKSQPQNRFLDALFSDPWTKAVNRVLSAQGYVSVKSIRLQGLLLIIYSLIKHVPHLRGIEAQFTKTGLNGMWGNKGAVSIRFNLYGCSICFVNAHLTAHDQNLNERIHDYNNIIRTHMYHVRETSNILFHDYVFWIGDLNFRTDHPVGNALTPESILNFYLNKVEKGNYDSLLEHDQLLAVMKTGEAFSEFKEPPIHFPPTYKYDIGQDNYDLKRKPSWTDRILYKVTPDSYENVTLEANLISYEHMPQYRVSDHKPVVAQFKIKVRPGARPPLLRSRTLRSAPVVEYPAETMVDTDKLYSNFTEKTVEFILNDRIWYIGDADFRADITLSADVEVYPNDWIGIYDADFVSLENYIGYEYLGKVTVPSGQNGHEQNRRIPLTFPLGSDVRIPGFYRFIYFSQPCSDVRSVLGISEPFEVCSIEDKNVLTEPCNSIAGTSRCRPSNPTTPRPLHSPHEDILSDFRSLDVANLSKHFSNDLNID